MLVYFHIDELARDAVVASALKKELAKRGGTLVYGNRFTTEVLLKSYASAFDVLIMPSLPHYMTTFPDPSDLPDDVFILQTEAIGQATGTLKRLNGKYFGHDPKKCEPWHKSVRGFLLWGYAHTNSFHEFYPEYLPKTKVVGHPRLSSSCNGPARTKTQGKPVVGFVSRFNLLSPFDARSPLENVVSSMRFGKDIFPVFEGSDDKDVEDMYYTEVIDFRIMLQIMMSLDPNKYELTVRPHPRENRMNWMNLAKKLNLNISLSPWEEPFGHWLEGVDFIITPPSTSLYDTFFRKKSALLIHDLVSRRNRHILVQSDDNNQILDGCCKPKDVEELIQRIEFDDVPYDEAVVDKMLLEQVGADIAANSTVNILDAIDEMRVTGNEGKRISYFVYSLLVFVLSHLRCLKFILTRRVVQGATFDLTWARAKWIDKLTKS